MLYNGIDVQDKTLFSTCPEISFGKVLRASTVFLLIILG